MEHAHAKILQLPNVNTKTTLVVDSWTQQCAEQIGSDWHNRILRGTHSKAQSHFYWANAEWLNFVEANWTAAEPNRLIVRAKKWPLPHFLYSNDFLVPSNAKLTQKIGGSFVRPLFSIGHFRERDDIIKMPIFFFFETSIFLL